MIKEVATTPTLLPTLARFAMRLCVVAVIAVAAHLALDAAMVLTEQMPAQDGARMRAIIFLAVTLLYAIVLALPFVPGVEIGIAILLMRGAEAAPAVYVATVLGLSLAYLVGRRLPLGQLQRLFEDLRMQRAAQMIETIAPLSPGERLNLLQARLPGRIGKRLMRTRYVAFAVLLNLPLNAVIGGGGGLAMLAGISGLFRIKLVFPLIALAVLPIPLAVWIFGVDVLPLGP